MTITPCVDQLMQRLGARPNARLSRYTFVQVGGPADWFLSVRSQAQLIDAVRNAQRADLPLTMLGAGSNVLIRDGGLRGLVLKNDSRDCRRVDDAVIEVDSGVRFAALARATARAGLRGLEWAAGIPGAIGGGLPTNAGAYGSELSDVLLSATAIDANGDAVELPADQLELGYRSSRLRDGDLRGLVVVSLRIQLSRGDADASLAEIERVETLRKANAPAGPSLGSTFRNPSSGPTAGELIERAGLKGERIGAAQVSDLHANYILNVDTANARAVDFLSLMARIQRRVAEDSGIQLEPEIAVIGEEASDVE